MPKPLKQKAPKGSGTKTEDHISDPRFVNIQTDPRFRIPSKKNTHVQIDERFAQRLHGDEFSIGAKVDKLGRKLSKNAGRNELKKWYTFEDGDGEDSKNENDDDEQVKQELDRVNAGDGECSSSENSSSDDDDSDEAEEVEIFGLLNEREGEDGIPNGEVSSRLAVVNLDWDNIRAADLMAVFSSFVPSTGRIRKISVYPSNFGKERMEREEMDGPPKDIFGSAKVEGIQDERSEISEEIDDDQKEVNEAEDDERIKKSILKEDKGLEFNSAKLRRYQLERLRYFYAVLDCSSKSVAQTIYDAVDGTEYLTTANFFDLRYVSDEQSFSEDEPRDECERIPDGYRPNEFVTDALQHSKVRLTWDADDGSRKEAQKRAFAGSRAEIDENDLKAYLGSDSSEDEGPEPIVVDATAETSVQPAGHNEDIAKPGPKLSKKEAERQKMRALLGLQSEPAIKKTKAEKRTPVGDMQVTFSSGLTSEINNGSVFENEPDRDETTAEKYVRKEKERKSRRKDKMKANRNGADPESNAAEAKTIPEDLSDEGDKPERDLGFSDPFFTAPSNDKATTTAQRKADKRLKKEQKAAEEASSAAKRAELELLMVDDNTNTRDMNHFDINEIAKAEKALSKKKKSKKRLSEREKAALEAKEKDQFKIDVADERFRNVFERSDFAIDPSHPRFKGTEGMKKILEEGRKKRKGAVELEEGEEARPGKKAKRRRLEAEGNEDDDVRKLVARVKGKTKKSAP